MRISQQQKAMNVYNYARLTIVEYKPDVGITRPT